MCAPWGGGEGDNRDGHRPKERPLVLRYHIPNHVELVFARFDSYFDPLGDEDRIVGEHVKRNDQSAHRYTLHEEIAVQIHHQKSPHDCQKRANFIINPALRPMANSSTTKTIVTALPRLKLLVALTTALCWKLISPISMPI